MGDGLGSYGMPSSTESVSAMYPLSVLPVVDYMLRKEAEVKNIRMIAYGTQAGLDSATIKGLLVI